MNIRRLLYSIPGKFLVSIILGLGLATLFRKVCRDRKCLVFRAASLSKIKNQVFKFGDKCYTFTEGAEKCDSNKKTVEFA